MISHLATDELLSGLSLCAFVPLGGKWRRIGQNDGGLLRRFPELTVDSPQLEQVFPFLAGFLREDPPSSPEEGELSVRSGPWTQRDAEGRECPLEAIWIECGGKRVLLLEILGQGYREKLEVFQAARENRLAHERLVKTEEALRVVQRQLEEANDVLEQRVARRTRELLHLNEKLRAGVDQREAANQQLLLHQEQLRSLTDALVLAEEEERRRIAAGLHDGIGQTLAVAKMKLGELARSMPQSEITDQIAAVGGLIDDTIGVSRTLTFELVSPVLYEIGLEAAIGDLLQRVQDAHGIETELLSTWGTPPLSEKVRLFLFHAVRELLHNCVKHAEAGRITVTLAEKDDRVEVKLEDDGRGFSPSPSREYRGFGLFNVRERLEHLGGEFELNSAIGVGTRVTLRAPLSGGSSVRGVEA